MLHLFEVRFLSIWVVLVKNMMPLTEFGMLNLAVRCKAPLARWDLARVHLLVCVVIPLVRVRRVVSCLVGGVDDYLGKVVWVWVIVVLIVLGLVRLIAVMMDLLKGLTMLRELICFFDGCVGRLFELFARRAISLVCPLP